MPRAEHTLNDNNSRIVYDSIILCVTSNTLTCAIAHAQQRGAVGGPVRPQAGLAKSAATLIGRAAVKDATQERMARRVSIPHPIRTPL